jgi:hypothetical protein
VVNFPRQVSAPGTLDADLTRLSSYGVAYARMRAPANGRGDKNGASRRANGVNRDPTVDRIGARLDNSPALRPERLVVPNGIYCRAPGLSAGGLA